MNKRQYLSIAMGQTAKWLEACIAEPSKSMRPIHIALLRIALRRKVA